MQIKTCWFDLIRQIYFTGQGNFIKGKDNCLCKYFPFYYSVRRLRSHAFVFLSMIHSSCHGVLIILWYTPLVQFVELFILKRVCPGKENRLDETGECDLQTEDNSIRICLVKTALLPSFSQVEHATTTRMVLKGTHSPSGWHLFSAPPCQNTQDFKDHDDLQLSSLLT